MWLFKIYNIFNLNQELKTQNKELRGLNKLQAEQVSRLKEKNNKLSNQIKNLISDDRKEQIRKINEPYLRKNKKNKKVGRGNHKKVKR